MDFERFKNINDQRLNYREMEDASVVSSYRNTGCGDGYRLYLKIDGQGPAARVVDASYTTTGCGFGLAALAMATDWVRGRTIAEAERISPADIEALFEFPERRKNYPQSACEALQKAAADFLNGTGIRPEDRVSKASALALLAEQGHLRGAKLNQVILEGEDLSGVDFSGADLSHAYLLGCKFDGANLSGVRLRGAFLNGSSLRGADLRNSDLRWAKLSGADLEGAQFEGAQYDVGTRLDPRHTALFAGMVQSGKEAYVEKAASKAGS
ncbi:MAG: pentapeptide repeat-containing protein [Leptospirales bacterium]|nr:pentapeptide repeat-containing protein [Leptospirales bacterium]